MTALLSAGIVFPLLAGGVIPAFSTLQSLQDSVWEPLEFPSIERHTRYRLVQEDGVTVVRADSDASASGLIARQRIDPGTTPYLEWRWRISNIYQAGDAESRSGDDYPARIYVAFEFEPQRAGFFERAKRAAARVLYGKELPGTALNYIWANRLPAGRIVSNPYSEQTRMLAVRSGSQEAGRWQTQRQNMLEDYREAFGREPPDIIGIGIMSDSDNTGESVTAWYGDIVLSAGD